MKLVGLNYFVKRYYDADIGIWTSVDPCRQHWSGYTYGSNNPVNRIDPDGCWDTETDNPVYKKAMERREQGNVDPNAASDALNEITPDMIPAMATPEFAEEVISTNLMVYGTMFPALGALFNITESTFESAEQGEVTTELITDVALEAVLFGKFKVIDDVLEQTSSPALHGAKYFLEASQGTGANLAKDKVKGK